MKNEAQIIQAIANAGEDDSLRWQIIIQDNTLHVYINRPTEASLDYATLKQKIYAAIADLCPGQFQRIWLHCRILGSIEPDWQSVLEVEECKVAEQEMTSMVEAITSAVDATNSVVSKIEQELITAESFLYDPTLDFDDLPTTAEEELFTLKEEELAELLEDSIQELDLGKYCFIRNRRLLYAVLDPPWSNIAHLINTFAHFNFATKRSQLPVLEAYFENSVIPDLDTLESKTQIWWRKIIRLDSDNRHKLAIWLSRYCLNAEQTMITIKEVCQQHTTLQEIEPTFPPAIPANLNIQPQPHQVEESTQNSVDQSSAWLRPLKSLLNNIWTIFRSLK